MCFNTEKNTKTTRALLIGWTWFTWIARTSRSCRLTGKPNTIVSQNRERFKTIQKQYKIITSISRNSYWFQAWICLTVLANILLEISKKWLQNCNNLTLKNIGWFFFLYLRKFCLIRYFFNSVSNHSSGYGYLCFTYLS